MIRRPAFWLWAAGCAAGLALVIVTLVPQALAFPAGAAVGLGLLTPALLLAIWFFVTLGPIRPRPLGYSLMAVAWGLTAAFAVALSANTAFIDIIGKTAGLAFADRWGATIAAPIDEEAAKLAGVALLALMVPRSIRGPLDGFGYGALVGIGFEVIEDFLYVFNTILWTGAVHNVSAAAGSFFVRVVFGAWWSHWTFTCVSGAGLGYLVGRTDRPLVPRIAVAVGTYVLAMAMHAWFDSPFLSGGTDLMIWKGAPLLIIALAAYAIVRRDHVRRFRQAARHEASLGILRIGEDVLLASRRRRRSERRRVLGDRPRFFLDHLRSAQIDLVEEDLAARARRPAAAERLRHDVVNLRALLEHALAVQPVSTHRTMPEIASNVRAKP